MSFASCHFLKKVRMQNSSNSKERFVQKYVDVLTNGGFKALFGDENNKDVVMDILNVLLPENRRIASIDYLPTEHQGPVVNRNKEFHYDFMCRDASGVVFIVELQKPGHTTGCIIRKVDGNEWRMKKAVVYTSEDGATWFKRAETNDMPKEWVAKFPDGTRAKWVKLEFENANPDFAHISHFVVFTR